MRRLCCILLGHLWRGWAVNPIRAGWLGHTNPRAGWFDVCCRCGEVWDDTGDPKSSFRGRTSPMRGILLRGGPFNIW